MSTLRPLRGRIAVAPIDEVRSDVIVIPATYDQARHDRSRGILAQSSHRGRVLAAGAPARIYDRHEVPLGFGPGDVVLYVFASGGVESTRRGFFGDEPCVWITQEEVLAVEVSQ